MYNHLLDVFKTVVDEGSFAKAGDKLFLSTASVMNQINSLEEQLHMQLLVRNNKGCYLTKQGKIIYDGISKVMDLSTSTIEEAKMVSVDKKRKIFISSFLNDDVLFNIKESFINIDDYEFVKIPDHKLNELLISHELNDNVCFGLNDHFLDIKYNFSHVGDCSFEIWIHKNNPLSKLKTITFDDIKNEKLIYLKNVTFKNFDIFCKAIKEQCPNSLSREYEFFSDINLNDYLKEKYSFISLDLFKPMNKNYISVPFDCVFRIPYGVFYGDNIHLQSLIYWNIFFILFTNVLISRSYDSIGEFNFFHSMRTPTGNSAYRKYWRKQIW